MKQTRKKTSPYWANYLRIWRENRRKEIERYGMEKYVDELKEASR